MKQKYKSPEMMQEKGVDFHTKFLKKTIKAMIGAKEKEVQPFFYNTEFDFGEGVEPHPVLFIGEIPSKWKKYMKANKASKTFAYGDCIIDEEGLLKMQVKVGKGGKPMILKDVNKQLLKPFCKAYFVESIGGEVADSEDSTISDDSASDTTKDSTEDTTDDNQLENWLNTAKNFVKEANQALKDNLKILNEFEKPMANLKNTVVTDDFIEKATDAKKEVKNLDAYLVNLEKLMKNGKPYQGQSKDADNLLGLLGKQVKQIEDNQNKIDLMLKNMEGLKQLSNPKEAEIPIIEDDPVLNFLNRVKKAYV